MLILLTKQKDGNPLFQKMKEAFLESSMIQHEELLLGDTHQKYENATDVDYSTIQIFKLLKTYIN